MAKKDTEDVVLAPLDKNYRILFEACASYKMGDVVKGRAIAGDERGIEYLLKVGAVEETTDKEVVLSSPKSIQDTISEAVAKATKDLNEQILVLNTTIEDQDKEIEDLKKKLEEATKPAS